MELKRSDKLVAVVPLSLLIVPYGIETIFHCSSICRSRLLIVPYGIETTDELSREPEESLLIVPYGIETSYIVCIRNGF